jgi:hypothetical protein
MELASGVEGLSHAPMQHILATYIKYRAIFGGAIGGVFFNTRYNIGGSYQANLQKILWFSYLLRLGSG